MLLTSVALRLLESSGTSWWLIAVPSGSQLAVAHELREEIEAQAESVYLWPGEPPAEQPPLSLFIVTNDTLEHLTARLDAERSRLAHQGVLAFVVSEEHVGAFMSRAPHVASFIGTKILETSTDEAAPLDFIERRLDSLRSTYGLSDDEARERFSTRRTPETLDFLEWMVLLEALDEVSSGDG